MKECRTEVWCIVTTIFGINFDTLNNKTCLNLDGKTWHKTAKEPQMYTLKVKLKLTNVDGS